MSEKILFITDSYEPAPSSNGVCVARLWRESAKIQYSHLLALTPEKENERFEDNLWVCHYKRTPSSYFNRFFGYAQNDNMVAFLAKKAEEIIEEKGITTVLCTYRPVENLICAINLKKKYGNKLRVCSYFLDNLTEVTSQNKIKSIIFEFNQKRLIRETCKACDKTLLLKYYKKTFTDTLKKDSYKLVPVGLPGLLKSEDSGNTGLFDENRINLVYTGSFYNGYREPEKILSFLKSVTEILPSLKIHLYCWGCDSQVEKAKAEMGDSLVLHGRVTAQEAHNAVLCSDALLNVGNDLPNQVPGKLLEYFATGKPIVNFVYREDDPANEDYEKYGNIFNVKNKGINNPEECARFLEKKEKLPWDKVQSRFSDCEPIYTITKITEGAK